MSFTRPRYARPGDPIRAADFNANSRAIEELQNQRDVRPVSVQRPGSSYVHPFAVSIGGPDRNRLLVAVGHVYYTNGETYGKPIVPTLDGTPLDAETPPSFDLTDHEDGAVWLVYQSDSCRSFSDDDSDEPERIELTDKGDEPPLGPHERAVLLTEFTLKEDTGPDAPAAFDTLDVHWRSEMAIYRPSCDSSSDSNSESDSTPDSSDSGPPDSSSSYDPSDPSTPSGSSDSDPSHSSSTPDECCPDSIAVSVYGAFPTCIPVTDPGPLGNWLQFDLKVDIINPYKCPDCHPIITCRVNIAGVNLPPKTVPNDGDVAPWEGVVIQPVLPCSYLGGEVYVYSRIPTDLDSSNECRQLLCTQKFWVRVPPYCGDSCSSSDPSSSSSSSAPIP